MPPIVSHLDIARPPAEVFGYATDPSRLAEWQDDVVGVRIQGGRPLGVGSRFTTTRRVARLEFSYTQEITALDPPSSGPLAVSMDRSGQARASPSSRLRRASGPGSPSRSSSRGRGSAGWCRTSSASWRWRERPRATSTWRNGWNAATGAQPARQERCLRRTGGPC